MPAVFTEASHVLTQTQTELENSGNSKSLLERNREKRTKREREKQIQIKREGDRRSPQRKAVGGWWTMFPISCSAVLVSHLSPKG